MADRRRYDPRLDRAFMDAPIKTHPQTPAEPGNVDYVEQKQKIFEEMKSTTPVQVEPIAEVEPIKEELEEIQEEVEEEAATFETPAQTPIQQPERSLPETDHSQRIRDFYKDQIDKQEQAINKPIYRVIGNPNDKVAVVPAIEKPQQEQSDFRKNVIAEMIVSLQRDIMKAEIEIEIHQQLKYTDINDTNMNQRRIESFMTNKDYLTRKLEVLKKML